MQNGEVQGKGKIQPVLMNIKLDSEYLKVAFFRKG
jgi:hypothetical protein